MAALTIETLAERLFAVPAEFISVREAAKQTSVSERTIRRHISSGEIASTKLGNRRLVKRSSLTELLNDE